MGGRYKTELEKENGGVFDGSIVSKYVTSSLLLPNVIHHVCVLPLVFGDRSINFIML
jgi:hypothetical protein